MDLHFTFYKLCVHYYKRKEIYILLHIFYLNNLYLFVACVLYKDKCETIFCILQLFQTSARFYIL